MGKRNNPRHGSMQFWPRVRAKKECARVRTCPESKDAKPLIFPGYKAGMTQVQYTDGAKNSLTKGQTIVEAVTIIECPPVIVVGIRAYARTENGLRVIKQVNVNKVSQEVKPSFNVKEQQQNFDGAGADKITLIIATQPKLAGLQKKKADIVEVSLGGTVAEQIVYAKEHLGKQISITDLFKQGEFVDVHAVSKGKGYQGPVKRFGVSLRQKKSEKTKRGPGCLSAWHGQGHMMYRTAFAGKMGYHLRTDYNKRVLMISDDVSKVNPLGGIGHYGLVKSSYLLIKGSVSGPKKRLITVTKPIRVTKAITQTRFGEVELVLSAPQN